jgi:uncharacterized YccA/Bax inhibitor family protein
MTGEWLSTPVMGVSAFGYHVVMPNPLFNESSMQRASQSWAPPTPTGRQDPGSIAATTAAGQRGTFTIPPVSDGPVTAWQGGVMTPGGTISAALVLFTLLLVTAAIGWTATPSSTLPDGTVAVSFPMLAWVGLGIGFVAVIALAFRPKLARVLAPIYALAQGFFVGAISKAYESAYDGIVVQAAAATVATFFVMLVLYRTGIIKVTDKFRRIVIGATLGIMVMYGISFIMMLFGGSPTFLSSPSLLGIGLSLVICVVAAMNLALDFDLIERGSASQMPKYYEWYAAFGLLVTMIWLYLEFLRLLAKLRD